jgi:hypothetical protein
MKLTTQDYQWRKEFFRDRGARGFNLLSLEGQANAGAEVIEDMVMFLNEDQQERLKNLIECAIERALEDGQGADGERE